MIVEVRGTGSRNKGAELMLVAILQELSRANSQPRFAVEPHFGPFETRAKYGLLTKIAARRGRPAWIAKSCMSRSFRNLHGLVDESDIDFVVDASGFAFGDQWGSGPSEWLARQSGRWQRRGVGAVLLPQAFGPFSDRRIRAAFRASLDHLRLVFARDKTSYNFIQDLGGPFENVKLAPDFTNVVKGVCPANVELPDRFACVVPNVRMLDRTSPQERDAYAGFLARSIRLCRQHDVTPVLLYHTEGQDRKVADMLKLELGEPVEAIEESDPVHLKGILGRAEFVIGSRFHALVGALSQAVPAIGTSWSHKYEALFDDYGCREFLLAPTTENGTMAELIARACYQGGELRASLEQRAESVRERVQTMFADVSQRMGA